MPRLAYWPTCAVPEAVQVIDSPEARVVCGQLTTTPWSSLTSTLESGSAPTFVTRYSQLTAEPTGTAGPGAASASNPLVDFSSVTPSAVWPK